MIDLVKQASMNLYFYSQKLNNFRREENSQITLVEKQQSFIRFYMLPNTF